MTARPFRLAVLCLSAAILAACGGAEERKAEHLEKAIGFFESGNFEKANIEFKNVLQIDPKVAKPYVYLGKMEESKKNWRQAYAYYQKAVELDPSLTEAKIKVAQFLLLANERDKAAEMIAAITKEKPDDLDVRLLTVALANAKGQAGQALADVERLVSEKPKRADPYIILATLYAQKARWADAESALADGLAVNPGNTDLLVTQARFFVQRKNAPAAEKTIKALITGQPDKLPHRVMLSELYMNLGRFDQVEETLRTASKDFPDEPAAPMLLAEFFLKRGDAAKAESTLRDAIAARPQDAKLQFALARLLEQTKRLDQAEKLYRDFAESTESKPDAIQAKNLLANLLYRLGRGGESRAVLAQVLDENPHDADAQLLKGRIALAARDAQEAIAAFRAILKDQPESTEILTLLATANAMDGKPAIAQENLDRAVALKPNDFNTRKSQVEFLVQQKNFTLASEKVNEFLVQQPKSLEGLNLKADVLALSNKPEELEALLKSIKADFPDNAVGAFRLGNFYQAKKKYDAALAEYEAALQRSRNDYDGLKAIMALYLETNQSEKALARIKKALSADPKHPTAHQLLGALYASLQRMDEAVAELNTAIELNPSWLPPYINLGEVYERKGERPKAIETYQKALKLAPADQTLQFNMARVFESGKEFDKAITQYESILVNHPDNVLAVNNLASILSSTGRDKSQLDRALNLAKRLESSQQPAFMDTLAWIYYQLDDVDKGLALQQQVVEKQPNIAVFQYHLGMMYAKKGEKEKAKEFLGKAVQSGKEFQGVEDAKATLSSL